MNNKFETITELYLDGIEISQVETKDLEQTREFMEFHYGNQEEQTSIPTSKDFSFSIDGNVNTEDATHLDVVFNLKEDILNLTYYIGRKENNFGYNLPVRTETISINHAGGETVSFSTSFRAAGPITLIV